ncbi:hypothetical protein H7X87_01875 [Acetobacteraceae bacterium]|nr:hypothetical protein [Candidatus Parcubacteria bacterium]
MSAKKASPHSIKHTLMIISTAVLMTGASFFFAYGGLPDLLSVTYSQIASSTQKNSGPASPPPLDRLAYDTKLLWLAHVATSSPGYSAFLQPNASSSASNTPKLWPVRAAYPRDSRALLPFNRIIAYYGNFYSRGMGVLGQYDPPEMLSRLKDAVAQWKAADPETPVIPAIHYIAIVAQGSAGKDGKYRTRMPDSEIDKALTLAKEIDGIVFLDLQVGLSDLPSEVPVYEEYLKLPNVHLGLDPEFAMHNGTPPGRVIGTFDASDINYAAQYLANLVRTYDLPPKILVIHRFTGNMLTNYKKIEPLPEVQVVIDMDGWGGGAKKKGTYNQVVYPEPVQFAGFKLFYKNDTLASTTLLTPREVLELTPAPVYIQYQ